MTKKQLITLKVNGDEYAVAIDPWRTLNEVLRHDLNLIGTKLGCGTGDCGACTVLVDGRSVTSCLTLAAEMHGRDIVTIEGVAPSGLELHPIQDAMVQKGGIQCGYCTPGMVLSALHLLQNNPDPSEDEIKRGLDGNLCRCTGYYKIIEAVADAAKQMRQGDR